MPVRPCSAGCNRLPEKRLRQHPRGTRECQRQIRAQILQRFVNKVPWAHLDIAGVAWQDAEQKPLAPSWGTGWGVRLLNRLVSDFYE